MSQTPDGSYPPPPQYPQQPGGSYPPPPPPPPGGSYPAAEYPAAEYPAPPAEYPAPPAYGNPPAAPAYGNPPAAPAYGQPPSSGGQPPYSGGQPPYGSSPYGGPSGAPTYPAGGAYPSYSPPKRSGAGKVIGIVVAVVVGVVVLGFGALVAIGLAMGDQEATSSSSASAPAPDDGSTEQASDSTPPAASSSNGFADGQKINSGRLRKGDCVKSKASGGVSDLDTVDCTDVHDGEVVGLYDATGGSYPGETAIAAEAEKRCADFIPKNLETTDRDDLSNYYIYPKSANWSLGDHEVVCLVVADKPLTGPLSEL